MCKILRCAFNRMSRCFRGRRFSRTYGFAVALAGVMVAAAAHAVTPEKYYDYVQSTKDIYVDIDYTPKGSTVIEAEFTIDNIGANNTIFCSRGSDNKTFTLFYISDNTGKYFRWDYSNAGRKSATFNPVAGDRYYARASIAGLFIDGQIAESITGQSEITPNNEMILFGSYKPSTTSIAASGNYARMKLYWFKAYDYDENNKLVLSVDLVPAMVNNVVGLYDRKRDDFYSSANSNSLVAGNEITLPTTVSLRTDVIDRGYSFDPGGVASLAGYGSTNLFDGVRYTASTIAYAQNARWIANDSAVQYVDIESDYFNVRSGSLVSYVLHKCSMTSYAPNSRAPISWRIEGVLATSADDDAWVTVDEVTDFAWPGVDTSSYTYNDQEPPSSEAYASATFSVPGAKQAPYRRLRFVPTNSKMKEHNASEANKYSLMEVDFRVRDAVAGMDPGTLMVTGTPDAYGESAPGYGPTTGLSQGSEVALSIPEMVYANDEETLRATCTGWKVYTYNAATRQWDYDENDPSSHGTGNSFTYTHGSVAGKVEWQFKLQAYVDVSPLGDGTVTGSGWYDVGSQATITATANGTNMFRRWEDMPEGVDGSTAEVTFTVTGPVAPKASIGGVRYVAKTGNDETNTGLSAESPFLTINHALIDLGEVGGTVYVAEGGYVETNGVDLAAMNIANEVALVGMTGRAEDVRVTTAKDGVTRHVLHLNHPRASARFMTFRGGGQTTVNWGNNDSGFNVRIGANGGVVEDCIIRDASGGNYQQHGQGIFLYGGRASRCRIQSNTCTSDNENGGAGLGANAGLIEDCLIVSNKCNGGGAVYLAGTAKMVNCTVAANTGGKYAGVYVSGSNARVVNCAILGNVANDTPEGKVYRGTTTGFVNCVADLEIPDSTDCVVAEPSFRDMANGDFRPTAASACIDAGVARAAYGTVSTTDVGGSTRVVGDAVDVGCYENQKDELECGFTWSVASPIVPASVTLTGTASADGATYAWRIVNETTGAEATVPASASNTYVFETGEAGLYSVTITVSAGSDSASHTESAIFRLSPKDVYVDASSTSPEFPYDTWAKAATAVATGVEAAAEGATVHVADGLYEIGAQILVDKGIRLVGESGRPSGVVVRRTANNVRNIHVNHPDAFVANMTFENGLIAGHGGCLYLNGKGGTVSNCVFRGGRTTANNDYSGGGVLMFAGLLTHCEITDCTSVHKDGGNQCRVLKMNGGRASNCLIHGNVLDYTGTVVYLASGARIENCTIVDNTVKGASKVVQAQPGSTVRNCVIFAKNEEGEYAGCTGDDGYNSFWPRRYENCATKGMIAEYTTANGGKGWYSGYDCVTNVTEEACFVNYAGGKFRPKKDGPLWNAGTNGVGVLPPVDFAGNPRIYKEIIDIGCLEGIDEGLSINVR